ncbi:MAG: leucine-rich repeat domain-containing protein [Clostridiales bacterium]|nr:leucine-rich repeat domain-containing protein [Clostridiales bacterium]
MKRRVWMKRIFIFFVVCCLACLMKGELTEVKAEMYGDYVYDVLEDGTISISYYLGSYEYTSIPSEIDGKIVTSIGDGAFAHQSGLRWVQIPESVTSIGNNAFAYSVGLTEVVISEGVTSIGNGAFADCSGLRRV